MTRPFEQLLVVEDFCREAEQCAEVGVAGSVRVLDPEAFRSGRRRRQHPEARIGDEPSDGLEVLVGDEVAPGCAARRAGCERGRGQAAPS